MKKTTVVVCCALFAVLMGAEGYAEVGLTVYNMDLALVKDVRQLDLKTGVYTLQFTDVAAAIDPTSVSFSVQDDPEKVQILEQNFQYDLVGADKILSKYLDRQIQVITEKDQLFEGTLLSTAGGLTLMEPDGKIRIIAREGVRDMSFPELPEGLITRPTLVWLLDSELSGKHPCEVRYLTKKINWHAEYVATVSADDDQLNLAGWVSIDNRSGTTYENARLKLIAGDVHMVPEPRPRGGWEMEYGDAAVISGAPPAFEEKAFFEYHLYTLTRPATVRDNEIKQLSLFAPADVTTRKIFTYDGAREGKKVRVNLEFKNSPAAGLGIPLPKGKIRVMKADEDGSLEFVGEDQIDHTPKDEKVRVYLGNAFDIVGERTVKDHRRVTQRITEEDITISLRNRKDEAVTITVIEHLRGDWEIRAASMDFRKKDAYTVEFDVQVRTDEEVTLTFTVRNQ
jgi:hypothetical protein